MAHPSLSKPDTIMAHLITILQSEIGLFREVAVCMHIIVRNKRILDRYPTNHNIIAVPNLMVHSGESVK